jgi:hypothetical protein
VAIHDDNDDNDDNDDDDDDDDDDGRQVRISEREDYMSRYWSISSADGVVPQPTVASLDTDDIRRFYQRTQGDKWDGVAEIVFATVRG